MEARQQESTVAKLDSVHTSSLLEVSAPDNAKLTTTSSSTAIPVSPLGDKSVRGYDGDVQPKYNGAREIVNVIRIIEAHRISCCIVGEAALVYYGAKRVLFDWLICVSTEHLEQVVALFAKQPEQYEPFAPNALNVFGSLNFRYPRYKLLGQAVFFVVMTSQACHMQVNPATIEYDRWINIPYPKLQIYAQSLLDTWNLTDLEDLVDGMNLNTEWGETNLDLDGSVDQVWACWREEALANRILTDDEMPQWSKPRRDIWHKVVSAEAKRKRQGWKSRPEQLTRFWISGQQDPREKQKDYS